MAHRAAKKQVDAYLEGWGGLIDPFWNGHIYQNFPDQEYDDYRWNYWGEAFATLLAVKQKYDPGNLFAFPQMVSPAGRASPRPAATPLRVVRALRMAHCRERGCLLTIKFGLTLRTRET